MNKRLTRGRIMVNGVIYEPYKICDLPKNFGFKDYDYFKNTKEGLIYIAK